MDAQARALDEMLAELGQPLDSVVQLEVDYGELTRRISGRRSCADCGRVFNVLTCPPGEADKETCPKTGGAHRLFQRPDDNEATVAERLRVYDEKTKPLIAFYREQGILRTIGAMGELDDVTQRLEMALESVSAPATFREGVAEDAAPTVAKKRAVGKAPARKKAVAKTPAKAAAKKGAASKAPARQSGGAKKKAAVKKTAAKKAPAKKAVKKTAAKKKAPQKSRAAKKSSGAKPRRKR